MDKIKLAREHAKNVEPENKGSYADFLAGFNAAESIANAKIQELEDFRQAQVEEIKRCDSNLKILNNKITELEQQLKKADSVIEFYGEEDNFHVNCLILDEYDQGDFQIICEDMNGKSEETDDFTQRARQYLKSRGK